MLELEKFLKRAEPELRFVLSKYDGESFSRMRWKLESEGTVFKTVRGNKMTDPPRVFDEFAAAFQFPLYFGENWQAFQDCIADLEWFPDPRGFVVVIEQADEILADATSSDLGILISCLENACKWFYQPVEAWDVRLPVPFHVILRTTQPEMEYAANLWRQAGAKLQNG